MCEFPARTYYQDEEPSQEQNPFRDITYEIAPFGKSHRGTKAVQAHDKNNPRDEQSTRMYQVARDRIDATAYSTLCCNKLDCLNFLIIFLGGSNMLVQDAQREVRTVFVGGFWGQLVSSTIWLASAALGFWATPRAAIFTLVIGGFFIFPVTQLLLRLAGGPASLTRGNPLNNLGMQIAFTLPLSMFLLVPVTEFRLNLFYPALMILLGAHYLPFTFLYGMRMFFPLGAILVCCGVAIAHYFPGSFSLGGWIGGLMLFVFAWIGRAAVQHEARGKA